MKILIVDDKKETLYLLERIITKMGYEVVMAENGEQALKKLNSDNFIMVISDILMPKMDGFQLCKAVKSNKKFNDILFVFYTATYIEKEDEEFALDLGADKFIRKPLKPEKFIEIIKNLIQKTEISQVKPSKPILKEEKEILKLYSERLIHKLEKKILDLEKETAERKKVEEVLLESEKKYREAYNRAEFYKDLFAHDINNILQGILSGEELSELYLDNPENLGILKKNIRAIKEQIFRGAELVSNIRKLSQLEEVEPTFKPIDILNLLKKTLELVKTTYKERDITIQIDSINKKLFIQANDLLEDVFKNILINAIRHNKNPIVEIIVKISKEQRKGAKYIKMAFLDNGNGIEDNRKKLIFQRGYSKDKRIYGIGLGLLLVKKILETFKGKIWVEDRVKGDYTKGSNFIILIPEAS